MKQIFALFNIQIQNIRIVKDSFSNHISECSDIRMVKGEHA